MLSYWGTLPKSISDPPKSLDQPFAPVTICNLDAETQQSFFKETVFEALQSFFSSDLQGVVSELDDQPAVPGIESSTAENTFPLHLLYETYLYAE